VGKEKLILVTGAAGMLGRRLMLDAPAGVEAVPVTRAEVDLAERDQVARLFSERGPFRGVIHAAGYTDVDGAEREPLRAWRDNRDPTRELAAACARAAIPLLMVSTDFVFDGRADRPYSETEAPAPLGVYGKTKWAAERLAEVYHPGGVCVARTAWLYGPGKRHFVEKILERARGGGVLEVVADQHGSPTSTLELAPALWDLLVRDARGLYHAACEGACTRLEWARAILELAGVEGVDLRPAKSSGSHRPAYSALDCSKLARLRGRPMAPWREALKRYLEGEFK